MYDRFTNAPRGFGFVTFKDAEVARKVIGWDKDHIIHGKKVDCKPATARKDAFKRNDDGGGGGGGAGGGGGCTSYLSVCTCECQSVHIVI